MSALEILGIPHRSAAKVEHSSSQKQTEDTFSFKWAKRDTYDSPALKTFVHNWMIERYAGGKPELVDEWMKGEGKIILDAGCGAGLSGMLFWGKYLNRHHYLGVDVSDAVNVARTRFEEQGIKGDFIQSSLMDLDFIPRGTVDIIFAEGVLHHTDSTKDAILSLSKLLKEGGRFMFYVYKKKAPAREFTDDYIRENIASMSNDEAWAALMPLSKLGRTLGELNITIDVEENIDVLGIPAGKYDLQRLFYWFFVKAYYRPEYSLEEMNHINFDWFRPKNCHRHTPEEIAAWSEQAGLEIERLDVQDAGISVVGRKKS